MSLLNFYYSTFLHALNHNHLFQSTVFYPQDDPEERWHISTVARQQGVVLWQTGLSWRWSRLTQMWWYNTQMGSPHNDLVLFFIPQISVFVIATPTGTRCENCAQLHICWSLQSSLLILICFELCFFWRNINKKKIIKKTLLKKMSCFVEWINIPFTFLRWVPLSSLMALFVCLVRVTISLLAFC